jgi:hypothetical protein
MVLACPPAALLAEQLWTRTEHERLQGEEQGGRVLPASCVRVQRVRTKIKSEKITFSFRGFSPRERSCTSVPTLSLMLGSRMLDYWYVGDQDSVYRVSTLSGDPSLVLLYTPARSAVLRDVASATPAQPPTPWSHPLAHGQRPL